jgi:predicted dehydrogenase
VALSGGGTTRVAVIGANGIGRHHAKWWALEGADVCAFAGSSRGSVERTGTALRELFGFTGRGYLDISTMLREERPDIVDVCSPPQFHAVHCKIALAHGAHVLCEKPFVYDAECTRESLLAQARELADFASRSGLCLGVCTQYSVGARWFQRLWRDTAGATPLHTFEGHLESPAHGRPADSLRTWADLAPHPISMLLELAPHFRVDWESAHVRFDEYMATAQFRGQEPGGTPIDCRLNTRNTVSPPGNVRRCVLNGWEVCVEGYSGNDGVYRSRFMTPEKPVEGPDLMHTVIGDFIRGVPPTTIETAIENLDIMLRLIELAVDQPSNE